MEIWIFGNEVVLSFWERSFFNIKGISKKILELFFEDKHVTEMGKHRQS
jgi:NAD-dependent DNA ligase